MTDVFDVIVGRRTSELLVEPGPSPEEVAQLVLAAECAPDHLGLEPWRLVAIQGEARLALADAYPAFTKAPFVLAVIGTPRRHPEARYEDQVASAAAAAQNVLLAATALGYGSIWRTDHEVEDELVHAQLGLEEGDLIVGFLHIGTIPEGDATPPRLPTGDRVSFLQPA
jgi:nitroreductase